MRYCPPLVPRARAQQPLLPPRCRAPVLLALGFLALGVAPAALADGQCSQVPNVGGIDQSPTSPDMWGKCSNSLEGFVHSSHWCKFGQIGTWPGPPTDKAKKCMKFGRTTIYRGPIYGSSPGHKAACNKWLYGDDQYAMVAVSTKYLKTYHGGWAGDKGACGKCMCIRLHGGDDKFNQGLQKDNTRKHLGLTFMGKVRASWDDRSSGRRKHDVRPGKATAERQGEQGALQYVGMASAAGAAGWATAAA